MRSGFSKCCNSFFVLVQTLTAFGSRGYFDIFIIDFTTRGIISQLKFAILLPANLLEFIPHLEGHENDYSDKYSTHRLCVPISYYEDVFLDGKINNDTYRYTR